MLTVFCTVWSTMCVYFIFIRKGGMGQESCESQAFTIYPGSCPRLEYLLWDPYVCESPWQHQQACWWVPVGFLGRPASGQTHTVGRPGHQCWNGDQLWNLGKSSQNKSVRVAAGASVVKGMIVSLIKTVCGFKLIWTWTDDYFQLDMWLKTKGTD